MSCLLSVFRLRAVTKVILSAVLFLSSVSASNASSYVIGLIYLKTGGVIGCSVDDRIKLPKRFGKAVFLRNAYTKEMERERFAADQIDSIIAWHPATPEHARKFIASDRLGWLWVYFETPQICISVYSPKGYGIDTNGGIRVKQRIGLIFCSRTAYCLKKTDAEDFEVVGTTRRKSSKRFRKKVAEYVKDDPDLSEKILKSEKRRDSTLLMLLDYAPTE